MKQAQTERTGEDVARGVFSPSAAAAAAPSSEGAKEGARGVTSAADGHNGSVKGGRGGAQMAATGYGNHGASKTKNYAVGWRVGGGSAEDDSDLHGKTLRTRARDLDAAGGLARGATRTLATNCVGTGLTPRPTIDREVLGLSDEAALAWARQARREFALWADSKCASASRQFTFWQMQRLVFVTALVSGDTIGLFTMKLMPGTPYETHINLLEADRLATPGSEGESTVEQSGGNRIVDGVEIDSEGMVVAYHIASKHPLAGENSNEMKYTRIEAYDALGNPNVMHIMEAERPEQRRGISFAAPMIEQLKQLERYEHAELTGKVVSSMFTMFITTTTDGERALDDTISEDERVSQDESRIELGAGTVYRLRPGENVAEANPKRSDNGFEKFVDAICTQIGSSMEIPKEVLLKVFGANYSASRAALLEFWKKVKQMRAWFVQDFCKPVYEAVVSEAVAKGRLEAPGFFDDPLTKQAWLKCDWIGSNMGQVDPKKEAEAAALRIMNNLSTQEREAAEMNGGMWQDVMEQRLREAEFAGAMAKLVRGNDGAAAPPATGSTDDDDDEEEDDE